MALLELRKKVVLCYADYQLAEGEEKARAYEYYLEEKENMEEQLPQKSTVQEILQNEESFESLVFWLQGQMGKKQGVSMTLDQIRCLTLYDLYTLKKRFNIEQPVSSADSKG